jgi:hypothetical protein
MGKQGSCVVRFPSLALPLVTTQTPATCMRSQVSMPPMSKENVEIPDGRPAPRFPSTGSTIAPDHLRELTLNGSPPDCSLVRLLSYRRTSKRPQLASLANLSTSLDPLPNDCPRTLTDILDEAIRLANETFDLDFEPEGSAEQDLETKDNEVLDPNCDAVDRRRLRQ